MKGKRFSEERIVGILKEAECQTSTVQEICRKHGVSEQSFYRWRKKYGGLSVSEAKRLKEGSSLFSVGNGSLCIGFADPGTRPRTPGIYRFEVQTWLL